MTGKIFPDNAAEVILFFLNSTIGQLLQIFPVVVFAAILYIGIRIFVRKKKEGKTAVLGYDIACALFVGYIVALIALVWVPTWIWGYIWRMIIYGWYDWGAGISYTFGKFNFVPSIAKLVTGQLTIGSWVRTMLTGNVLIFIPFGVLFPLVRRQREKMFRQTMKYAMLTIIVIEVVQPFVGRSFDIDDIICNLLGVVIGYSIVKILLALVLAPGDNRPSGRGENHQF